MDIQKCYRFLDIHNSFLDIQKSIYGYPKIHFWTSKNHAKFWISIIRISIIHNSFLVILYPKIMLNLFNSIFGYPFLENQCILGYHFWISKNHAEFRISIIRFLDIHNSILGYPKMNLGYHKIIMDIQNYFWISKNVF